MFSNVANQNQLQKLSSLSVYSQYLLYTQLKLRGEMG